MGMGLRSRGRVRTRLVIDFTQTRVLLCSAFWCKAGRKNIEASKGRLAQLDRASASGAEGRAFESRIAHIPGHLCLHL